METLLDYVLKIVFAGVGTFCFAIIFCVPKKHHLSAALTGAVGWAVYIIMLHFNQGVVISTLVATLALTLLSKIFSLTQKAPMTIFLFCGIFPLVPGAGIYYTAYYFMQGDMFLFAKKGIETLKIAIALSIGISAVTALQFPKRRTHNTNTN